MNILLIENKSSRQTAAYFVREHSYKTPLQTSTVWGENMSCCHPTRTYYLVTYTRLDATFGI